MGPLQPLIHMIQPKPAQAKAKAKETASSPGAAWLQRAIESIAGSVVPEAQAYEGQGSALPAGHDHTKKGPENFNQHYQYLIHSGVPENAAWNESLSTHGDPGFMNTVKRQVSKIPWVDFERGQQRQNDLRYKLLRPAIQNLDAKVLQPTTNFLAKDTIFEEPGFTFPEYESQYVDALAGLAPLAKEMAKGTPGSRFEGYIPELRNRGHISIVQEGEGEGIGSAPIGISQAILYDVLKRSGPIDTNQFYRDLEETFKTNPHVYVHGAHHAAAYGDVSPEDRALHTLAHLGAQFGSNIYDTPLGKYYQGILEPPTPENRARVGTAGANMVPEFPLESPLELNFPAKKGLDWESYYNQHQAQK